MTTGRMGPDLAIETGAAEGVQRADVLYQALEIIRKHALYLSPWKWTLIVEALGARVLTGSPSPALAHTAIRRALSTLDNHSCLLEASDYWRYLGAGSESTLPTVKCIGTGVWCLTMRGYSGTDQGAVRAYVTHTLETIATVARTEPRGWLLDLRGNHGGNMWPMLAGLQPFLGQRLVGTFVDRTGLAKTWPKGSALGDSSYAPIRSLEETPVVVMQGPRTSSSGEAVAIAFHGRPRTRFLGRSTAGRATATQLFPLADGSALSLVTSRFLDRTGRCYCGGLEPELSTAPNDNEDTVLGVATATIDELAAAASRNTCKGGDL